MGHLKRSDILSVYHTIKRESMGKSCSVLIMVAPTVDGLCSVKILSELFKCDFITFKIIPVSGYDDLMRENSILLQLQEDGQQDYKSLVFIDCGGTVDLGEIITARAGLKIYVFDSHRPFHLTNIFGNSQLTIVDDGFINDSFDYLQQAFQALSFDDEEEEEEEEINFSEEEEEQSEKENDENTSRRPPSSENKVALLRRERRAKKKYRDECVRKYTEYYQTGTWYGTAVSRLLLDLSDSLGRGCNDHLWCSILGVTSKSLLDQIDFETYTAEICWLRERCLQLNRDTASSSSLLRMTDPNDLTPEDYAARYGRIKYEDNEYRFMLMRHWSLYESMLHSRYLATRLNVWREKGHRLLETFIAKMGIPLSECKMDYSSMSLSTKDCLPERIKRFANEFKLNDVAMPSFVREYGFTVKMSASDAVYALMALLEQPLFSSSSSSSPNKDDPHQKWIANFHEALDAIDPKYSDKLRRGIDIARRQHQFILKEAINVITHQSYRVGRRFRYIVLQKREDVRWLSNHPLSLTKMLLFLTDALKEGKRNHLPLLLAAPQFHSNTYLIVTSNQKPMNDLSEEGSAGGSVDYRNMFGRLFKSVARRLHARVRHDGFDSSVIEINHDDFKPFLNHLQTEPLH